ncbi:MAG: LuxR C-terminal-related transcriptional regulator [Arcanobacterium sp.]|nr:LuxR C-terminal-related transcriptional regulator [Arcanobacterium sp.]
MDFKLWNLVIDQNLLHKVSATYDEIKYFKSVTFSKFELPEYDSAISHLPSEEKIILFIAVSSLNKSTLKKIDYYKITHPFTKIILIQDLADNELYLFELQPDGIIDLESFHSDLVNFIQKITSGENIIIGSVAKLLLNKSQSKPGSLPCKQKIIDFSHRLPKRYQALFICIIQGMNNQEISQKLYLSEKTVRTYISELLQITGAKSKNDLHWMICKTFLND